MRPGAGCAQAEGLKDFMSAADADLTKFYLALEHNLFPTIASECPVIPELLHAVHTVAGHLDVYSIT